MSEDELDWLENQSQLPYEVARKDFLLFVAWGLAAALVIAMLVVLYRYAF